MKRIFVFLTALFSFMPLFTFAQEKSPDSLQTVEFSKLKNNYVNNIAVNWSKDKGTPGIVTFSNPIFIDRDKAVSARKLLVKLHGILSYRSKIDSLIAGKVREDDGDKYITFNQSYKDIPVVGGEYVVSVLRNGNVQGILGSFYKNITVDINPNINTFYALEIIMKDNMNLKDSISSSRLVIFPADTTYYLSWEMNIPNKNEEGVYTYYIDAKSGEILYKNDNVIYEKNAMLLSPQPEANAYLHHPLIDQNYSYISPLDEINLSGYLQGSYANVLNYVTSRAYNSNRSFLYSPSNTHFDEANLYYHITKFRKNFWNVVDNGFNAVGQIPAYAHKNYDPYGNYQPANAYYYGGYIAFGDGVYSGYNDFSKEDKVIYHEYTHAVTIGISGLTSGYNESGAINEGNSDYFAGSFTNRSKIGEYVSQGVPINETWQTQELLIILYIQVRIGVIHRLNHTMAVSSGLQHFGI